MNQPYRGARLLGNLLLLAGLVGCSGGGGGATVTGTVTLDGKPLDGATLTFEPFDKTKDSALGGDVTTTDAQGQFTIDANPRKRGLRPGKFAVWIARWVDREGKPPPPGQLEMLKSGKALVNSVPGKYSNPEEVPVITAEIKSGKNEFKWDLSGN